MNEDELLNALAEEASSAGMGAAEEHIVIGRDRSVTVPDSLKKIGVQFDHNVETVMFDCPRYWDNIDMSEMTAYVNYMREDGYTDSCPCGKPTPDETDSTIMHFNWTVSGNVTKVKGSLVFLVCIKKTDGEGYEANHWNSELNRDMYISEGLEAQSDVIIRDPDLITQLLIRIDASEASDAQIREEFNAFKEATNKTVSDNKEEMDTKYNTFTSETEAEYNAFTVTVDEKVNAIDEKISKVVANTYVAEAGHAETADKASSLNAGPVDISASASSGDNFVIHFSAAGLNDMAVYKAVRDGDGNKITDTYTTKDETSLLEYQINAIKNGPTAVEFAKNLLTLKGGIWPTIDEDTLAIKFSVAPYADSGLSGGNYPVYEAVNADEATHAVIAKCDEDGKDIRDTYATKAELSKIEDGTTIVGKATHAETTDGFKYYGGTMNDKPLDHIGLTLYHLFNEKTDDHWAMMNFESRDADDNLIKDLPVCVNRALSDAHGNDIDDTYARKDEVTMKYVDCDPNAKITKRGLYLVDLEYYGDDANHGNVTHTAMMSLNDLTKTQFVFIPRDYVTQLPDLVSGAGLVWNTAKTTEMAYFMVPDLVYKVDTQEITLLGSSTWTIVSIRLLVPYD